MSLSATDNNMAVSSRPRFIFPAIHENPTGWGPCEVPEQFKDTPYQPFSKGDRLGKVKRGSLASHTLQSQEKEGLVTVSAASCSIFYILL